LQLFLSPKHIPINAARLLRLIWGNIIEQKFISHRSRTRWAAHWFIFWGCVLAAMITFPLSFGWIRFETASGSEAVYQAYVFGVRIFTFDLDSLIAPSYSTFSIFLRFSC